MSEQPETMPTGRGIRHMPALDGLRGAAVIAVLLYHGDVRWARGGYLGVDAFFVLSGFLITSLLLAEWRATGTIDLRAFWTRRARRLLPARLVVLAAVAVYATVVAAPVEFDRIRLEGLATLAYVANWAQIFSHTSYFESFGAPSPLRHTWSLAIEEQFYLVWPLVVLGVLWFRRGSHRALLALVVGLIAASAITMAALYSPGRDPSRVYYGTDTRAQSLLIGVALAIILASAPTATRLATRLGVELVGLIATGALVWLWSTTDERSSWQYRGGFLLFSTLVALVIASVTTQERGPLARVLSLPVVRGIGIISYGLYLWHWPVYVFLTPARVQFDGAALLTVRLLATTAIALASFFLVESPIRHGALRGPRMRVVAPLAAAITAIALVVSTAGALPAGETSSAQLAAAAVPPPPTASARDPGASRSPRVMLVGDSMPHSLAPGLAKQAAARHFALWDASVPGCGLADTLGERHVFNWKGTDRRCVPGWRDRWPAEVEQFRPDVVVVLLGIQDAYDRRIDGTEYRFDTQAGADLLRRDLREAIRVLGHTGAHVVFLSSPYYVLGWLQHIRVDRSPYNPEWIDRYNTIERAVAAEYPSQVTVLDLNRLVCPDGKWADRVAGVDIRDRDSVHLSSSGADFVARWLIPDLLAAPSTNDMSGRATAVRAPSRP